MYKISNIIHVRISLRFERHAAANSSTAYLHTAHGQGGGGGGEGCLGVHVFYETDFPVLFFNGIFPRGCTGKQKCFV
jgi:hypothetical protein